MKSFKEWFQLQESMSVYVQGHDYQSDINDLDDVANILKKRVLYPAWEKLDEGQQKKVQEAGSAHHGMIVPDGDYYGEGKNLLNFYIGGWPEEMVPKLVQGIKYFLDNMGIKYAPFETNTSGMYESKVVRISILKYETSKNSPALLNLSNDNATLIFRDLLKFPSEEGGFTDISPADLYRKIEELEKDMIDIHARDAYSSQRQGGAAFFAGGLSTEQITSRLEQIKQIAKWAMDNHYDQMYVL